ncbi:hypothetical protein [Atlantibacter sp.]|uniref:hypothetical protein n=1 Tax=Atlantibacter sp. TaxID=1903473 RepID=UPI0028A1A180|nr:hypothetical protein [Atlantibacter sp.]EJP4075318.1 hypothetical protein [Escherichia coli]
MNAFAFSQPAAPKTQTWHCLRMVSGVGNRNHIAADPGRLRPSSEEAVFTQAMRRHPPAG